MTSNTWLQYRRTILLATLVGIAGNLVLAAEWPTVRGDYERSGISPDSLAVPLHLQWVHSPTLPPSPAWPPPAKRNISANSNPLSQSHVYDRAYHVVGNSGRLYYGSSADDTVYCLDAASGRVLWHFTTEGPVRLAPTVCGDKLYAGSDDGHLYCLDAESGKLAWRVCGAPTDRRFPGNERVISRCPVRAGIVVDQDIAYFTAGLFPSEGVYICAVRAENGEILWRQPATIAPQGYIVAAPSRLFVPSGRTPYHQIDRATGKTVGKYGESKSWGRDLVGGSFALLVDGHLATGPSEDGHIHLFNAATRARIVRARGQQLIVSGDTAFVLLADGVEALDRKSYIEQKKFVHLWKRETGSVHTMVLAANALVVGGKSGITMLDTSNGETLWSAGVDGRVEGLAIHEGQLIASSDEGPIYGFGSTPREAVNPSANTASATTTSDPDLSDSESELVRRSLAAVPNPRGYALVLGVHSGELIDSIRAVSGLRVIGVGADPDAVRAVRNHLRQAGVYGRQAVVHEAPLDRLPYGEQFAALVMISPPHGDSAAVREAAWRLVRPCGGVLAWTERTAEGKRVPRLRKRGAVDGSGEWTHFYGDAGNTACSHDTFSPGETEIQWFGRPGPHRMVDRHWKTVPPLYKNGRLFVSGDDYIAALDAHSGALLWERDVPRSVRIAAFKDTGNMVATDDCLYVAADDRCQVFDAAAGLPLQSLSVPEPLRTGSHAWGYVARVENLLFGSVTRAEASFRRQTRELTPTIWGNFQPLITSTALFALDAARAHEKAWTYTPETGVIINPTLAVAEGRVLFVESGNGNTSADGDGRIALADLINPAAFLVALDAATGRTLWREKVDLACMHHILFLSATDGKILLSGTRYIPSGAKKKIRYELKTYAAESGRLLWENQQVPDYDHVLDGGHGEQVQHLAIRRGVIYGPGFACRLSTGKRHEDWAWHKSHKCTTLALSEHCAFSRFSEAKNPFMFELDSGKAYRLTTVTRPGCWINMIPAGGLLLIPEGSAGCTCEYPIQTSLALRPVK